MEMVFGLLKLVGPTDLLGYSVLTQTDASGRNVLHFAVMGKHKELVERLVRMDVDHSQLRNQIDSKGKTPQQYDDSSLFRFETAWDCAQTG